MLLILTVTATWFSRDWWLPKVGLRPPPQVVAAPWTPPGNARRADSALKSMQARTGPAFANIAPADMLAYFVSAAGGTIPRSADSLQAAVVGDRFYVRFNINTSDIGNAVLGPLQYVVRPRERVMFGGTLRVIRPGLSELQVKDVAIRSMSLPRATIPALLRQIGSQRGSELSDDGVPLATPAYIGDVRIANGRITVYKAPGTRK